jgi:hypothetical protein
MAKNIINISPKNWKTLFPGTEGEDFLDKNFLRISAYDSPVVNYLATSTQDSVKPSSKVLETWYFYMPKNSIREETSHSFSASEGALADTLRKGKSIAIEAGRTFEKGKTVIDSVRGKSSKPANVLTEEPTFFEKTEKRKFDLILNLYGTSDVEAEIYNAIRFFKKNSHAGFKGHSKGTTSITFPGTFTINGRLFDHPAMAPVQQNRRHLILKNMVTEYNSEINFIDDVTGLPIEARLTLQFEEVNSLLSNDWDDEADRINIDINED